MAADALSKFLQKSQDEEEELQAENGRIFHRLQNSLTSASLASLSFRPFHLHQVLIYRTYVLLQLREFWGSFQSKLLDKDPYTASIGGIRLKLQKLQAKDKHACNLGRNSWSKTSRTLTACYTTRVSLTSRKSSKRSSSASTTTTH